ncbi:GTP pyrophosphokinase family protein [Gracilibacillus caseinilyticus]|uniref:GTP pyrophosphokinase family protein n=1 Tax=Gracilibacillus caseinilyticus TaxID=2932256 RepID=A0ABY4EVT1_9BACI|nr:GTP pyrophosphokinase family protein [Gracilibacillus caseinilyticus]UOQ48505.1 GTP pyrophosphokinase family protein [Gracilibacillus caseinilyticus]
METHLQQLRVELVRFMMVYKFALEEVHTKINILQQEFQYMHDYNPIEHVKSRVKSPESILKKIRKKDIPLSITEIQENIRDIAGIRINCSFKKDIYRISQMLENQKDITVIQKKDYIINPKSNGYRSMHLIIQIPIFMSDRVENVFVEIQIRTIAMDFWASLEHKIYYKYNKDIPDRLKAELKDAASSATELDRKMESIHQEINEIKQQTDLLSDQDEEMIFPMELLKEIVDNN